MTVKRISLANFRGFDQLDLDFEPGVTVLAGVNGVGKSGVLYALAGLLSRALPEFTPSKAPPVPFTNDDVQVGAGSMQIDATFTVDGEECSATVQRSAEDADRSEALAKVLARLRSDLKDTIDPAVRRRLRREEADALSTLDEAGDQFRLLLGEVRTDATRTGELDAVQQEARRRLDSLKRRRDSPVVVLYSTNRAIGGPQTKKLAPLQAYEMSRAFDRALAGGPVLLSDVMHWFRAVEERIGGFGQQMAKQLREVVSSFAPAFTDLRVEPGPPPRFLVTKHGVELDLRLLSDGERSLLALVFDLTRRLTIANPDEQDPVTNGRAIVLIDEIEHHLHPLWQRRILDMLRGTFKGCQFITTTHSPVVLSEAPASSVRLLSRESKGIVAWTPPYAEGLDTNTVLERLQGTASRPEEISVLLRGIERSIDRDNFGPARKTLNKLAKMVGDGDSDVIRITTMLDFLEGVE